ncbi:MAG: C40 family peptidase [Deltaproteobacteria bacterium]|nr:C40 family peptidase [Deltaproteobacteria bacterium]
MFGSKFNLFLSLVSLLILSIAITGCTTASRYTSRPKPLPSFETIAIDSNRQLVNNILKTAFSQFGNPYRYGGNSPETGFDCSGFVSWVYAQYGIDLPRSSRDMLSVGTPISKAELRPGDLVFFNYGYSHVGIYTGNDKYIHSPRTGKRIEESDLNGNGRREHYIGARRVIDNKGVSNISDSLKAQWVQQSRHNTKLALNDRAARRVTGAKANYSRGGSTASKGKKRNPASRGPGGTKQATAKTHKVKNGDTMYDLAKRYGVSTSDLVAHNNLSNGNKLKLGQSIKIPAKKADASKPKKPSGKSAGAKPKKSSGKSAGAKPKKSSGKSAGAKPKASGKTASAKPKASGKTASAKPKVAGKAAPKGQPKKLPEQSKTPAKKS